MSEAPTGREDIFGALRLDAYETASLLRIAIRRGEADLADRAAIRLYRLRGPSVWRDLLFSAFEDVSVGSLDALLETTAIALDGVAAQKRGRGGAPSWRARPPACRSAEGPLGDLP